MISSTTGARTNGRICRRLVIGITLLSGSVHAANSPPFALEYAADLSCPDAPAFSELVRAKLGPTAAPSAASAVPRVLVRLHATPSGFSGRLELHRLDASEYSREVSGGTCSEVANAIAFVLALALGAKDTAPEVAAAPEPPPPPAPTPVPVPPLPSPPAPVVAEQKASPSELSATRAAPSRIGDLGVGVQFGARTGLGPVWTTVGAAFVEVRRLRTTPFTLALRGSFVDGQAVTRIDSKGSTRFAWAAGRVEVCPALVRLYAGFALAPCVGSHIARIKAVGSPTLAPTATGSQGRTVSKLWVDGVATLRLSFPVQPWLLLEAQGDLLFPLTRYDFGFDPGDRMFSVPALARAGLLGLVARFP